jgi:hypothetical protein
LTAFTTTPDASATEVSFGRSHCRTGQRRHVRFHRIGFLRHPGHPATVEHPSQAVPLSSWQAQRNGCHVVGQRIIHPRIPSDIPPREGRARAQSLSCRAISPPAAGCV